MNVVHISYKSTNCYLIPAGDGWLMIDAGWPDTISQVLQQLSQNDISVTEINYLIVTHYHPDHAGLTQNLKDLGINLILHEVQIPYIYKINQYFKKNSKENFKDITTGNVTVISNSDSRSFMESIGVQGDLIFTPGHSDDSVSLVIDGDCAFTGDLPAYTLKEAYNDPIIDESWNLLKKYEIRTIYPGHGDPYELLDNPQSLA